MQGTWVLFLIQEDPTCCRATKQTPVPWPWSPCPRAHTLQQEKPWVRSLCTTTTWRPSSAQLEKACMQQQRPRAAPNKQINKTGGQRKFQTLTEAEYRAFPWFPPWCLCSCVTRLFMSVQWTCDLLLTIEYGKGDKIYVIMCLWLWYLKL